jgi:hypothetical protein
MNRTQLLITSLLFLVMTSCSKKKEEIAGDRNKFDGRYSITGTITDVSDSRIGSPGPKEYQLKTLSSTEIEMFSLELGINGQIHANISNLSYYSKFSVVVKFDPATNKIVSVRNGYGQPSENGRSAVLDPSGANYWDPATKNVKIKYWMDQTGVIGHKASFDETWTYIGPR